MRSIELRLRGKCFAIGLTDMSERLTRKQINPSRFTYYTDQVGVSVRVRAISYRMAQLIYFPTGSAAFRVNTVCVSAPLRGVDVKQEA